MADVRPFAALRYAAVDSLGAVIAPPYDVVSAAEQDALHEQDPHNVIRLELARGATDEPGGGRYARAADALRQWRRRNVLGLDSIPAFYPYEERFTIGDSDRVRRGLFAIVRLRPWEDRVVLPHERTRPKPKADRLELLHTCHTQFSPIFSMFEDQDGAIRESIADATRAVPIACAQVRPGGPGEIATSHQLWRIIGERAEHLTRLFANRQLFIADGHHRYETALAYREARQAASAGVQSIGATDYVMMLLVPVEDPGLVVLPTHRVVTLPPGIRASDALCAIERLFEVDVTPLPLGDDPGSAIASELTGRGRDGITLACLGIAPGMVHYLRARALAESWHAPQTWRDLDVGMLESLAIEPINYRWPNTSVEFTRDPNEALAHATGAEGNLAFVVNPTGVRQVLKVARAGERMPEKSTYFAPKVATGVVMYPLG